MLYEFQSGFRGNCSTDSCLIHLTDHIKCQNREKPIYRYGLIRLTKSLDTADHKILCGKLKAMGVESVKWFQSYLVSRTQLVYVNNSVSNFDMVTCGVPQGRILGPLLFLCYINDTKTSISEHCKF